MARGRRSKRGGSKARAMKMRYVHKSRGGYHGKHT
jgi:hypothetical protein